MIVKGPQSSSLPSCHRGSADGLVPWLVIEPALLWRKILWFRIRLITGTWLWKSAGKCRKIARGNSQSFSRRALVVITHYVRWVVVCVETYSADSISTRPRTECEKSLVSLCYRPLFWCNRAAREHFTTRWSWPSGFQAWAWRARMKWKPQQYGWYLTVVCLFVFVCCFFSLSLKIICVFRLNYMSQFSIDSYSVLVTTMSSYCEGNPLVTDGFPSQRVNNCWKRFHMISPWNQPRLIFFLYGQAPAVEVYVYKVCQGATLFVDMVVVLSTKAVNVPKSWPLIISDC